MKTTAAALKQLQDYYASLEIRPSIKEVASVTNMPVATAARYLNGTTQSGDPERVRALCIALERHDLLDGLPKAPAFGSAQEVLALIIEIKRESRESNLEELDRVRKLHEESEKRILGELDRAIKSKDFAIAQYTIRIEQLEKDKARQGVVNAELNGEMKTVRNAKRRRDVYLIVALLIIVLLLALMVIYLVKFDLPNPGYGVLQ